MLSRLTIRNFKCIEDLDLSLAYGEGKAPNGWKTAEHWPFLEASPHRKERLIPSLVLVGTNASGKSAIITALSFLQRFVTGGLRAVDFVPNRLHESEKTSTTFAIEFWKNARHFSYEIRYDTDAITEEKLELEGKVLFTTVDARLTIATAAANAAVEPVFRLQAVNALTNRQIKSFLGTVKESLPGLSREILEAYDFIVHDLFILPADDSLSGDILAEARMLQALSASFADEGLETLKAESAALALLTDYLRRLDFRIEGLRAEHSLDGRLRLNVLHQCSTGGMTAFPLDEESSGTRRAILLLGLLLTAIRRGQTVFIDELDASLHPLLVTELIRLFKLKTVNTQNAQLICTLHNLHVLNADLLTRSEVGIVDRTDQSGTQVKRIVDDPTSRNVDNFLKRYLAGQYRGIPYPYI